MVIEEELFKGCLAIGQFNYVVSNLLLNTLKNTHHKTFQKAHIVVKKFMNQNPGNFEKLNSKKNLSITLGCGQMYFTLIMVALSKSTEIFLWYKYF